MTAPRSIATLLLSVYALVVLSVIGSIAVRGWTDAGLMPRPSAWLRYECPAPNGPFSIYFRHGRDQVQLQHGAATLQGQVYDGKLTWTAQPEALAQLGFVPPREISYDSARFIRVRLEAEEQIECVAQTAPR